MSIIRIILQYKDLFDDEPMEIDDYLNGISKDILVNNALYYCSLSTILKPDLNNLFYPFLLESDRETKFENDLKRKVNNFIKSEQQLPVIINVRSSLNFFEHTQKNKSKEDNSLSVGEIKKRLLKVYLLINKHYSKNIPNKENINEMMVWQSLTQSIYSDTNCYYLRIAELIKSSLFLNFCNSHIPKHSKSFLKRFGLERWQEYILFIHQIGMLVLDKSLDIPLKSITIPIEEKDYHKKVAFFDKFCLSEVYHNDKDFTYIKSNPVIKDEKTGKYFIIFEQFFIEKMFKGLYFILKEINESFEGLDTYIKPGKFRSDFGNLFSERILLNNIIKDSIGKKYKHLGYEELQRDGCPDYYIRDGKNIFLFESKDNLIKKEVVELGDIDILIKELEHVFIENDKKKPKAIKQLINNISAILKGDFKEDNGIKPKNCVIYPIIVTHNTIFSLSGLNMLVDEWFQRELNLQGIANKNIKNITIININSLVLLQGILSQKEFSLKKLISEYWENYFKFLEKKYPTPELVISERFKVSWSFDKFVESKISGMKILDKGLMKYNKYFEELK